MHQTSKPRSFFNGSVGPPGCRQLGRAYGIDWGVFLIVLQYTFVQYKEVFQAPGDEHSGVPLKSYPGLLCMKLESIGMCKLVACQHDSENLAGVN